MTATDVQLSPRDIILEIGRNMHASCMPLISRVIVPSLYEVFLHQDDYQAHEPAFRLIREEAGLYLNAEIDRLNQAPSRLSTWVKTVFAGTASALPYERDGGEWTILFHSDPSAELARGAVLVSSRIQHSDSSSGAKTRRVLTERFREDARTIEDEPQVGGSSASPVSALAYIIYRDERGQNRRFSMERPEVSIGRGGDGKWVDLQITAAQSISKEHVVIRYNAQTRRFEAQDVSTNGTRVGGELLAPKTWVPIASNTIFELANGVSIEFKALR
jgi:hypothetical protein